MVITRIKNAARTKSVILCISLTLSVITAMFVVTLEVSDDDMFDSLTMFNRNLFSEQYSENTVINVDEQMNDAFLDAVGEKLTIHSVAE